MQAHRYERDHRSAQTRAAEFQTIDDLLYKQSKGKFLTREEKERITKYAEGRRKQNASQKKKNR